MIFESGHIVIRKDPSYVASMVNYGNENSFRLYARESVWDREQKELGFTCAKLGPFCNGHKNHMEELAHEDAQNV
jgi:hypothetical protein